MESEMTDTPDTPPSSRAATDEPAVLLDAILCEVHALAAGVRELHAGQRLLLEELRACRRGA